MEVPLAYLPGNVTRVNVRVVGDLHLDATHGVKWTGPPVTEQDKDKVPGKVCNSATFFLL